MPCYVKSSDWAVEHEAHGLGYYLRDGSPVEEMLKGQP